MPRKRSTAKARTAAHARAKARWRQRIASQPLNPSQPERGGGGGLQFIVNETAVAAAAALPRDRGGNSSASHEAARAIATGEAEPYLFNSYSFNEPDDAYSDASYEGGGGREATLDAAYNPLEEDGAAATAAEAAAVAEDEGLDYAFDEQDDTCSNASYEGRQAPTNTAGALEDDTYSNASYEGVQAPTEDATSALLDEEEMDLAADEAEDADTSYDSAELSAEAQLQQELQQQQQDEHENRELNLPLQLGLHMLNSFSCSGHAASYERHRDAQEEEKHWSLDDLTRSMQRLPDTLNSASILPYNSEHRQGSYEWARLFEGCANEPSSDEGSDEDGALDVDDANDPPTVCLACSNRPARTREARYDIDSIIGFAQSLAFARQGLYFNFAPQFLQNLHTNVHLTLPVTDDSSGRARTKHVPLFKVPHIRLGRVIGTEGISVYAFFPAQWSARKPTNFPGKLGGNSYGVLQQWTDRILLPSLASCLSSDAAQHFPPSFRVAQLRARARNSERQARTNREAFSHQSLYSFVQGQLLGAIWQEIVRRCQLAENALFANLRLVFSGKGTKLLYKGRTIAGAWSLLQQSLQHTLDSDHLNPEQVWVDLGKEVACADWDFPGETARARTKEAQVNLWRRCCIEHFISWLRFQQLPSQAKVTQFVPAMLGASLEATVEFARTSVQHANGWIYSQAYNSVKEIFDAAKVKPFQADFLDKLTWDPEVRTMLEKRGKAVLATKKQLEGSYLKSKRRTAESLRAGEQLSYGVREEHRLSLAFMEQMREALESRGLWDQPAARTSSRALPYWQLSSETYLTYLTCNVNKFTFAFEWLLGQH